MSSRLLQFYFIFNGLTILVLVNLRTSLLRDFDKLPCHNIPVTVSRAVKKANGTGTSTHVSVMDTSLPATSAIYLCSISGQPNGYTSFTGMDDTCTVAITIQTLKNKFTVGWNLSAILDPQLVTPES